MWSVAVPWAARTRVPTVPGAPAGVQHNTRAALPHAISIHTHAPTRMRPHAPVTRRHGNPPICGSARECEAEQAPFALVELFSSCNSRPSISPALQRGAVHIPRLQALSSFVRRTLGSTCGASGGRGGQEVRPRMRDWRSLLAVIPTAGWCSVAEAEAGRHLIVTRLLAAQRGNRWQ